MYKHYRVLTAVTKFCNGGLVDVMQPELEQHWRKTPQWLDVIISEQ